MLSFAERNTDMKNKIIALAFAIGIAFAFSTPAKAQFWGWGPYTTGFAGVLGGYYGQIGRAHV